MKLINLILLLKKTLFSRKNYTKQEIKKLSTYIYKINV